MAERQACDVKNTGAKRVMRVNFNSFLTRHIYVQHDSGDLNNLGTNIWEFFPKTFLFFKNETQYLKKFNKKDLL